MLVVWGPEVCSQQDPLCLSDSAQKRELSCTHHALGDVNQPLEQLMSIHT